MPLLVNSSSGKENKLTTTGLPGIHFSRWVVARVYVQPSEEGQHGLLVGVPFRGEIQLTQLFDIDVGGDDDTAAGPVADVVVHPKCLEHSEVPQGHAELGLARQLILRGWGKRSETSEGGTVYWVSIKKPKGVKALTCRTSVWFASSSETKRGGGDLKGNKRQLE